MKATGIVRKFDENGRFVIPMELRKQLGLETRDDALEVFMEDDKIILKKYEPACIFCGNSDGLQKVHGKNVCANCIKELQQL